MKLISDGELIGSKADESMKLVMRGEALRSLCEKAGERCEGGVCWTKERESSYEQKKK